MPGAEKESGFESRTSAKSRVRASCTATAAEDELAPIEESPISTVASSSPTEVARTVENIGGAPTPVRKT